ncbi:MAG: glycoside-pentoside-hexuronide (GPH):cation symporter [Clostridiales bacterium]|nr:glycoside-pentoside-hexuronide (GPH):cation symporter [Clostridiales bacterium]
MEEKDQKLYRRNKWVFGITGVGRNITYSVVTQYLLIFLTVGVGLTDTALTVIGVILIALRLFDAVNDPIMGFFIDNTRSKWGKFKPWIAIGGLLSVMFFVLLFIDYKSVFHMSEAGYTVLFFVIYFLFGIAFTVNDTAYYGILPSLTTDNREREKLTTLTNAFAGLSLFAAVAVPPLIYGADGVGVDRGMMIVALSFGAVFVVSQAVLLKFVKPQYDSITGKADRFKLKDVAKVLFKNDQLLVVAISFLLFQTAYFLTNGFGIYFFQFIMGSYGKADFTIFVVVLGIAQLLGLVTYRFFSAKLSFRKIFFVAVVAMTVGYVLFLLVGKVVFLPKNIIVVGIIGFVLLYAISLIIVMMNVLIADTIEYGQWKNGIRSESTIFAVKTFIAKFSGAVQVGSITLVLALSGLNRILKAVSDMDKAGAGSEKIRVYIAEQMTLSPSLESVLRIAMALVPLLLVIASYLIFRFKHKLTEEKYDEIIKELREQNEAINKNEVKDEK